MIGGSFVRGVSGGERKRVCIGNEIIINPSILFLDEPTSGLDSTTALKIVQMLQDIAEVLLIHIHSLCKYLLHYQSIVIIRSLKHLTLIITTSKIKHMIVNS